ncbi:MAG: glutamate--tRNA ligase [Patescibacteria group bacterium]|nr:glutamate--tRNA ligase [Patescibacteria group bacterium]MCL5261770.1 glutamate--tRNA ligase [Patescibacteria group bacterium]
MAPSPTGYFHIGSSRTALFNWLFARKNKGVFILRIEDTDKERSKKEYEDDILKSMKTLGLEWDEFYRQSERSGIYREYLEKLIAEDKAYYCFCTREDLEAERESQTAAGVAPKYSGKCCVLTEKEIKTNLEAGKPYVIRLKIPAEKVSFDDMIRGPIEFDLGLVGDIVIAKNLDEPLYNFSVVVDDILMDITHVIRGEDHIPNTPKQIALYRALGRPEPTFGHLPLILSPDRSKMSKRYGDVSIKEYLSKGYLPEAIVNFVALLGWHPKNDKEIMVLDELVDEFDIDRVQKAGAVFDIEKLNWINRQYLNALDEENLTEKIRGFIPADWKTNAAMIEAIKPRLERLGDAAELLHVYFELPDYDGTLLFWKGEDRDTAGILKKLANEIETAGDRFDLEEITAKIMSLVPQDKKGDYLWPLRVSLSGSKTSPTPFELLAGLGKEESLRRIKIAIEKLGK